MKVRKEKEFGKKEFQMRRQRPAREKKNLAANKRGKLQADALT